MTTDEGAAKAHNSDAGNSAASKAAPPAHEPGQPSDKAARAIAEGLMVLPPGNGEPPLLKRRSQSAPRLAPLPDIPGQNAESAEVVPLIHEVKNLNDSQPHAQGAGDGAREPDRVAHHPSAFRTQATPLPLQGEEVPARRRSAGISPNPVPENAEDAAPVAAAVEPPPAPVSAGQPQAPQPSPPPGQPSAPPLQAIRGTLPEAPAARPAPVHPAQQTSLDGDEPQVVAQASSTPEADVRRQSQQYAMQEEIRQLLQQEMRQIIEHQARSGTAGRNEPGFGPPQYSQPMPMPQQAYPPSPGPNMQPVYQPQPLMPAYAQWAMHPYQAQQYYPAGMPGYAPAMPYQQPVPPQVDGYPSVPPGYAPQTPQPCPGQQLAQGYGSPQAMAQQSPLQPMEQPPTQQSQTQPAGDAAAAESAHLLASLLQYLPPAGHFWSEADRENWLDAAATLFDLAYGDLGHSERRVAERHNGRKDVSYGHSGYRGR